MPESGRQAALPARSAVRPRKRLGQHFLRDRGILPRILAAAQIESADDIVEIGAGTGVLTEALAGAGGRLLALELDDRLTSRLRDEFAHNPRVRIWHGNALEFDPCEAFSGPYKLVANIPYYITGPLVRHFLESGCQPRVLVLMVQREVAERMVARPGQLSLLGVSVQYYAGAELVTRVPAGAFFPPPKVESALVRLVPYRPHTGDTAERAFFTVARAGFGLKRKQLVNSLMHGLALTREQSRDLLAAAGIEPQRRPETLDLSEWLALASYWLRFSQRSPQ
jgi:16S rRNA (adenine1518-N6/adenine1519-N6)-dimethyltransferase